MDQTIRLFWPQRGWAQSILLIVYATLLLFAKQLICNVGAYLVLGHYPEDWVSADPAPGKIWIRELDVHNYLWTFLIGKFIASFIACLALAISLWRWRNWTAASLTSLALSLSYAFWMACDDDSLYAGFVYGLSWFMLCYVFLLGGGYKGDYLRAFLTALATNYVSSAIGYLYYLANGVVHY